MNTDNQIQFNENTEEEYMNITGEVTHFGSLSFDIGELPDSWFKSHMKSKAWSSYKSLFCDVEDAIYRELRRLDLSEAEEGDGWIIDVRRDDNGVFNVDIY